MFRRQCTRIPTVSSVSARVLPSWLAANQRTEVVALLGAAGAPDEARSIATALAAHLPAAAVHGGRPSAMLLDSRAAQGVAYPSHLLVFALSEPSTPVSALNTADALAVPPELDEEAARLSFAAEQTVELLPHQIGTLHQALETRAAVLRGCAAAGFAADALVSAHVGCPHLTQAQIDAAAAAGRPARASSAAELAGFSRAASALGVGLATGEVRTLADDEIGVDFSKASAVAHASASAVGGASSSSACAVLVIGNALGSRSTLRAMRAVMAAPDDGDTVRRPLALEGLAMRATGHDGSAPRELTESAHERLICALAKADGAAVLDKHLHRESAPWTDCDVRVSQYACDTAHATLARLLGEQRHRAGDGDRASRPDRVYVSGGAEHQGPPGGGPVCMIYSCLLDDAYWRHVREEYVP
jgi:cyanuric acid amidohydrolase